jgi:hypothetical protein
MDGSNKPSAGLEKARNMKTLSMGVELERL